MHASARVWGTCTRGGRARRGQRVRPRPQCMLLAAACHTCQPGRTSEAGATACRGCEVGTFGDGNACIACVSGTASSALARLERDVESTSPTAGSFANRSGLTACEFCGPGTYSDGQASACRDCEAGRFASSSNASFCSTCVAGAPAVFIAHLSWLDAFARALQARSPTKAA